MITYLFVALAVLVLVTGLLVRRRVREEVDDAPPALDDGSVRRILEEGRLETDEDDEPLDLDEIRREEERFWDETWDEPDGPFRP